MINVSHVTASSARSGAASPCPDKAIPHRKQLRGAASGGGRSDVGGAGAAAERRESPQVAVAVVGDVRRPFGEHDLAAVADVVQADEVAELVEQDRRDRRSSVLQLLAVEEDLAADVDD